MMAILRRAVDRNAPLTVPAGVVGQSWRGASPLIARLLAACAVESLDEPAARRAGELLARARAADVIDAIVVLGATARRDAIVTSDPDDIRRLVDATRRKTQIISL